MSEVMIVSTKGQITLPSKVRTKFKIKAGDRIIGEYTEHGFEIKKPRDFFSLKGTIQGGRIPEPSTELRRSEGSPLDNEEALLTPDLGRHILERT
jgi:AbrB family looped-hinge helix DNA binding protein